jgi:hypothetical protein
MRRLFREYLSGIHGASGIFNGAPFLGIICAAGTLLLTNCSGYQAKVNRALSEGKRVTIIYAQGEEIIRSKMDYEKTDKYRVSSRSALSDPEGIFFKEFQPVIDRELKNRWSQAKLSFDPRPANAQAETIRDCEADAPADAGLVIYYLVDWERYSSFRVSDNAVIPEGDSFSANLIFCNPSEKKNIKSLNVVSIEPGGGSNPAIISDILNLAGNLAGALTKGGSIRKVSIKNIGVNPETAKVLTGEMYKEIGPILDKIKEAE